jgi:hypothetical protein
VGSVVLRHFIKPFSFVFAWFFIISLLVLPARPLSLSFSNVFAVHDICSSLQKTISA